MKTLIAFSSITGNTEKIARIIHEVCPFESDYFKISNSLEVNISEYELFIIGYWVENSKANNDTINFVNQIKNKKIVLFGTAGTHADHPYIRSVLSETRNTFDKSNEIIGHFICQGEIANYVIDDFEILANSQPKNKILSALLKIFREQYPISLGHPNDEDIDKARAYFTSIFNALQ
jgi:flavodoxin